MLEIAFPAYSIKYTPQCHVHINEQINMMANTVTEVMDDNGYRKHTDQADQNTTPQT
jgi:hypothetical protein